MTMPAAYIQIRFDHLMVLLDWDASCFSCFFDFFFVPRLKIVPVTAQLPIKRATAATKIVEKRLNIGKW